MYTKNSPFLMRNADTDPKKSKTGQKAKAVGQRIKGAVDTFMNTTPSQMASNVANGVAREVSDIASGIAQSAQNYVSSTPAQRQQQRKNHRAAGRQHLSNKIHKLADKVGSPAKRKKC